MVTAVATITVRRPPKIDRHGDPIGEPSPPWEITGARIGWAGVTVDHDHKTIVTTQPAVYFRRQTPDLQPKDIITTPFGKILTVTEIQVWEHPRRENVTMGTVALCEAVMG